MKNRDVLVRDPAGTTLVNNGQARVVADLDAKSKAELQFELSHFVCDGHYHDGVVRILESFLGSLGRTNQPAAWVSGFYGSGKSHLLKMLQHLWANTAFDDGTTARTLVMHLPEDVAALLRELDIQGKRGGGLHAVAGALPEGGGDRIRSTVLGFVFRSVGLPEDLTKARFCMWLKEQGFEEAVQRAVAAAGKEFARELDSLHVSPVIARALRACAPGLFPDEGAVLEALGRDFQPAAGDVTTAEFTRYAKQALAPKGKIPLTILVLDEVQQFIGRLTERAGTVADLAEELSKKFDSRLLLVGSGQSALPTDGLLERLKDRFTVRVELSDVDVETVTRKVLLAKKPEHVARLRQMLEEHTGEISRQCQGSAIGARAEDRSVLVDDYPLLPVRRRFWEQCLRVADPGGMQSQLRTQLRIVFEALREVGDRPLGSVVPADFLFDQIHVDLVQRGVLLRQIDERIRKVRAQTPDGPMAARLCGLVFLLRRLPRKEGADLGLRADAKTLIDLLISDLGGERATLSMQVPRLLDDLVKQAVLVNLGDEYTLQTREGGEWEADFRTRVTRIGNDEARIGSQRVALLEEAVGAQIQSVRVLHGKAKEPRKIALHFGDDAPEPSTTELVVWVRDGWSCDPKDMKETARRAGQEDATVYIHLPKPPGDALREMLVTHAAAEETLEARGEPSTDGAREARDAMRARRDEAASVRARLLREIVDGARVYLGGGREIEGASLGESMKAAAESALDRKFPRFREADHPGWGAAVERAKRGDDAALAAVDWTGAVEQHPVCKAVLAEVGASRAGREIRRVLSDAPYGWPKDAIDAALIALHRAGSLRATHNGQALAPGQIDQNRVGATEFHRESVTLLTKDRLRLRALFATLLPGEKGDDLALAASYLAGLSDLGARAGGEPPLPPPPPTAFLADLRALAGNAQLAAILGRHDELTAKGKEWRRLVDLRAQREPGWRRLDGMLRHADAIPECLDAKRQTEAIRRDRLLLDGTDRVSPLLTGVRIALRRELSLAHQACAAAVRAGLATLDGDEVWRRLVPADRDAILAEVGLREPLAPAMDPDDALLESLDGTSLDAWRATTAAVRERVAQALLLAAQRLEPTARRVALAGATLRTEADVREWLAQAEKRLLTALAQGPIVVG